MSAATKNKSRLCGAADKIIYSVNERILRECHDLYTEESIGTETRVGLTKSLIFRIFCCLL